MEEKQTAAAGRREFMLHEKITRVVPQTALPLIVSMLIDSFYNLADTFFVSQLGTAATAAVGINNSLMIFIRAVAMGFGMGAASYISRLLGAGNEKKASQTATTALVSAVAVVAVLSVFGYIFRRPLMMLLGAGENVLPYSLDYAGYILFSAPVTAAVVCLSQSLRAEGSTRYAMLGTLCGCVVNIGLDPLFIHVLGMQVAGAAIATGISKVISLAVLLIPFLRSRSVIRLSVHNFSFDGDIYRETARMGIPTFLRMSLFSISNVTLNKYASAFGDSVLAAVSIATRIMNMIGSAVMGYGQGFQPVAGYCWGNKQYLRVKEAFRFTVISGLGASVILAALMFIFAPQVISRFTDADAEVLRIGTYMVKIQCLVLPLHLGVMVANGLFTAIGRSFEATILGLSRQCICLLPSVIILSRLFDVMGLASAQAVADVLSACVALPMTAALLKKINSLAAEQPGEDAAVPAEEYYGENY